MPNKQFVVESDDGKRKEVEATGPLMAAEFYVRDVYGRDLNIFTRDPIRVTVTGHNSTDRYEVRPYISFAVERTTRRKR